MISNTKVIAINRPIDEVFTYVSNLQNGPEWQNGLVEVCRKANGPLGIGSQFSAVRKFLGRKMESVIEFVVYEPDKRIAFKSVSGSSPFEQSFLFETAGEGTKLTTVLKLQTEGLMGLAEPLIASSVKQEMEADLSVLKEKLEERVMEAFELLE
jgi:uncharacterized membrane protein